MKKLLLFNGLLWSLMLITQTKIQAQCPNLNFSMNDFTYWQAYMGNWNPFVTNCNPSNATNGRHTIMNAADLIINNRFKDENCNQINKVPNGFEFAARLGNDDSGAEMEALEYTITIDSTNSLLILHFAWIMELPNHPVNQQPRFSMTIKDSLGNPMTAHGYDCAQVNFIASPKMSNLVCTNIPTRVARNWTTVGFNLHAFKGNTIRIYFETRDCSQTGHFGYAYIVGTCKAMRINTAYCEDQQNANLSAPDGFVWYKWTRSSDPNWIEQGTDSTHKTIEIINPQEGEEITCELLSELDNCSAVLHTRVSRTIVVADFDYEMDTCSRFVRFIDSSYLINDVKESVLWEIPALNVVSDNPLFTYKFPDPPNNKTVDYLVRLSIFTENGCWDTIEKFITIYPSPQVGINGENLLCIGDSSYLNAVEIKTKIKNNTWTWKDINNITQSATGNPLKIYTAGTYTLTSTNIYNCIAIDTFTVYAAELPNIEIVNLSWETCEKKNGYIELNTNALQPVKFIWNTNRIGDTTAKVNMLSAGVYNVQLTDGNGCISDTNIIVDAYPTFTYNIITSPEKCNNENGSISINTLSEKPYTVKYFWENFPDTTSILNNLKTGIYVVSISDTLCSVIDTVTVELIMDNPIADFKIHHYDTCSRVATFINQSSITNGDIDSMIWTVPDLNISSNDTLFCCQFPDPTTNNAVQYRVNLTVFTLNGCIDSTQQYINVYPSPKIKIKGEEQFCFGYPIYLQAIAVKSDFVNHQWSWDNSNTANGDSLKVNISGKYILKSTNTENCVAYDTIQVNTFPISYIKVINNSQETCEQMNGYIELDTVNVLKPVKFLWNTGNTTNRIDMLSADIYHVVMTDSNNCKTDTNITVDLYPNLVVEVSVTDENCNSKNGVIKLDVTSAKPNTLTYIWENLPDTKPVLTGLEAGTYKVKIKDTLCEIDEIIEVETIDNLTVEFDSHYDTCERTVTFIDMSRLINGVKKAVEWKISNISSSPLSTDSIFTYTFPEPVTNIEKYLVSLMVYTKGGCNHSSHQGINVYTPPKVRINGDNIICKGDSIYLNAVAINSKFDNHLWLWEDENKQTQAHKGDSLKIHAKGTYTLISTNDINCVTFDTVTINEVMKPYISSIDKRIESCENENGYIHLNVVDTALPLKYIWNSNRNGDTTNNIDNLKSGKYVVKIVNENNCKTDTAIVIESYPLPLVHVFNTDEICERENATIKLTVNSAKPHTLSYAWAGLAETTPILNNLRAGTYRVTISDTLCEVEQTIKINHIDKPIADFEASTYDVINNNVFTLTDMSIGSIKSWYWDLKDGNWATSRNVNHRYEFAGDYNILLKVEDENQCIDTISKIVHAHRLNLHIPNMFTPNGDGINDVWKPVITDFSPQGYKLVIIDRWGSVLFFTTNTEEGWDGTVNGNPATENMVYIYTITIRDLSGKEYEYKGHLTLMR